MIYLENKETKQIKAYDSIDIASQFINVDDFNVLDESHVLLKIKDIPINRDSMPDLTPIEFDMKLRKAGLLQTVRDYVATNEVMEIAYTRATFFRRTDPFIETARIELGLTEDQVDQIWTG